MSLGYTLVALCHGDPVTLDWLHALQQFMNGVDVGWANSNPGSGSERYLCWSACQFSYMHPHYQASSYPAQAHSSRAKTSNGHRQLFAVILLGLGHPCPQHQGHLFCDTQVRYRVHSSQYCCRPGWSGPALFLTLAHLKTSVPQPGPAVLCCPGDV